jgi:hypothetical protein
MRSLIIVIIILAVLALGGVYYYFFYPPMVLKDRTEHIIAEFNAVVATGSREKIGGALASLLADPAHVRVGITYQPFLKGANAPAETLDFGKPDLISMVTNSMTPMVESGSLKLRSFDLAADGKTANIAFGYHDAEVRFYYPSSGAPGERRRMDMDCAGGLNINAGNIQLSSADCRVYFANPTLQPAEVK